MSSKIKVQRICKHCNQEFTARTTVTKYCSHKCNQRAYKAKKRNEKLNRVITEPVRKKELPIEQLKTKEFLTVKEVAQLLNCSVRSAYYYIENGTISAVNLGKRMTRIKRSEIDKLFQVNDILQIPKIEPENYNIDECYTLTEIQNKYKVSESTVQNLVKRNGIPKIKKGWYAYVPKKAIDKLFTQ